MGSPRKRQQASPREAMHQAAVCREGTADALLALYGWTAENGFDRYPPPNVFVYGHGGQGKTHVVRTVLSHTNATHAYVNCVYATSARRLFRLVLAGVAEAVGSSADELGTCDGVPTFIDQLAVLLGDRAGDEPLFIVLDRADSLRDLDVDVLAPLTRIAELLPGGTRPVALILVSNLHWNRVANDHCLEPIHLYLEAYTKKEVIHILIETRAIEKLGLPESVKNPADFCAGYVGVVVDVFYAACKNLVDLRHLCEVYFEAYCKPVRQGLLQERDSFNLFKKINETLNAGFRAMHLRFAKESGCLKNTRFIDMPFQCKYVIVSAYIASFNPAKTDKRFFVKHTERMSRSTKTAVKRAAIPKLSSAAIGPKPFALDRLVCIHRFLVAENAGTTEDDDDEAPADVDSLDDATRGHLATLIDLGMVARVRSKDILGSARFKCTVGLDFVRDVSRSLGFDVASYLADCQ